MTDHWEWAVAQALADPEVERVGILTDRMVFRTGMLAPVVDAARGAPDTLVSYTLDRVNDWLSPPVLEQYEWSGHVLDIDSAHLLRLAAERAVLPGCLPRMLNCVVPRRVLDAVKERFGSVFESVSPDFAFAFRSLVLLDSIRFLDASCVVGYAIDRSNGASIERGIASSDAADFNANLDQRGMNFATPVPELRTVRNAVYNEYCFVQAEARSGKAPPLRHSAYLAAIAMDLALIEDPELKRETMELIERNGWRWREARGRWYADNAARLATWFGRRPRAFARRASLVAADTGPGRRAVAALEELGLPTPPTKARPQFASTAEALEYADAHPPPREQTLDHLFYMLDPPGHVRDMGRVV
jgi:hypothetical protein